MSVRPSLISTSTQFIDCRIFLWAQFFCWIRLTTEFNWLLDWFNVFLFSCTWRLLLWISILAVYPGFYNCENLLIPDSSAASASGHSPLNSTRKRQTPLEQLRSRFFYVSDFVAHTWCPTKAYLAAKNPGFEEMVQEVQSKIDPVRVQPVIRIGTEIHEKRGLAANQSIIGRNRSRS